MNRYIQPALTALLTAPLLTSCLQDTFPTSYAVQDQVDVADKTYLVNSIPAYLNRYNSDYYYDIGVMGFLIWRDASTADMPIYDNSYDYFSYVASGITLGSEWALAYNIWERYYALVQKTNLVMQAVDVEANPQDAEAAGMACAYRANTYLEMAQWYEYRPTGFAGLDQLAESAGIMGLTVPLVTEKTSESDARHNPRAPFYKMYRFILTDLNNGEKYCYGKAEPQSKTFAGLGVIYGIKARFWLLLGTRFERHPEDLDTVLSHEDDTDIPYDRIGVTNARECFAKAAEYARKAIGTGYTPLNETQWYDPKTGFNSVNNSWMWGNIINTDNGLASSMTWQSWVSFMCPEASYGIAHAISPNNYGGYRMIDKRLFEEISDSDWRKTTWIAPEDVADESAFNTKYARGTVFNFDEWSNYNAYCGFKYHPANGSNTISTIGNAVSIPMMRVEEMYLIEAEALGRSQGEGAGRAALESFVNTYRYKDGSYKSTGAGIDGFIDDVFTQKRIELWGEGQIMWDYRRLEKAIIKGYPGTNFPAIYRVNSLPDHVAPWTTFSIPENEHNFNEDCILNPDPSIGAFYHLWTEDAE